MEDVLNINDWIKSNGEKQFKLSEAGIFAIRLSDYHYFQKGDWAVFEDMKLKITDYHDDCICVILDNFWHAPINEIEHAEGRYWLA